ncbi:MAG: 30S ribosomal protein S2 [Elusimicrobia bacterium]|nr:30S ribosomal protein S2 [Elusimicrobiota bacterium]MBU2615242.1 30S ribosomal protein S2 [Elusimicrobiota bacterium]
MSSITMKSLLEAGVHFGHQTRQWNPKMSKFIFCERNKIHIIDLQKTVKELKRAYKFVRDMVALGKPVLFVGTKKQSADVVETEAKRCGAFFVSKRWLGGTLTNFATIRKSVNRLKELEKMKEEGIFELLSPKERSKRQKEMMKLESSLRGIKNMGQLPGVMFVVSPTDEDVAVQESKKMHIPIVAICDTNSDPDIVDYPIPGNDDAVRAISLFCSIIADAVMEGKGTLDQEGQAVKQTGEFGIPDEELAKEVELNETKG